MVINGVTTYIKAYLIHCNLWRCLALPQWKLVRFHHVLHWMYLLIRSCTFHGGCFHILRFYHVKPCVSILNVWFLFIVNYWWMYVLLMIMWYILDLRMNTSILMCLYLVIFVWCLVLVLVECGISSNTIMTA